MPAEKIYKLETISIVPQYVTMTKSQLLHDKDQSNFRLQLWLGKLLLSQSYNLHRQNDKQENESTLLANNVEFKYFASNIFSKVSTAKLKLKLFKGDEMWQQNSEIQEFNIVLSKFTFNYSKEKTKVSKEHSVGLKNCSILYYRVECEYELSKLEETFKQLEQIEKEEKDFAQIKLSQFKQNDKKGSSLYKKSRPNPWLYNKNFLNTLPLNSLPEDYEFSSSSALISQYGSVYIQKDEENQIKFKIQKSYHDVDRKNLYSEQESIIVNQQEVQKSSNQLKTILYYGYLILGSLTIYYTLFPNSRV